jgi:pimeloyl-ACP methyl ester carboxylesterase
MPLARVNGINLNYEEYGSGSSGSSGGADGAVGAVVLVTGTGAPGRIWRTHQVPALKAAGYRVITVDNRGIPPTQTGPEGFTLDDLVADIAGLIEFLRIAPCRIVGFSLGAMIVQELLVARPELVARAVLMATRGRSDALAVAMSAAEIELADSDITLPSRYAALVNAMQCLSPRTLNDEEQLRDWLAVFELSAVDPAAVRGQLGLEVIPNRLARYREISCPCLVIGFQDDLLARPELCRELAASIPAAQYQEIPACGHYGYLEQPDAVNSAMIEFFAGAGG